MPAKLSTTINKVKSLPNPENTDLVLKFYEFMRYNGVSERLASYCIKLHGLRKYMIVYDPFIGVGNTALACLDMDVSYLGTESNEEYIKIANESIKERYKVLREKRKQLTLSFTETGQYITTH